MYDPCYVAPCLTGGIGVDLLVLEDSGSSSGSGDGAEFSCLCADLLRAHMRTTGCADGQPHQEPHRQPDHEPDRQPDHETHPTANPTMNPAVNSTANPMVGTAGHKRVARAIRAG